MTPKLKEPDGWVIVDYKTDDYESVPEKKEMYLKQLEMYKTYWEKLTGEKVKETVLQKA